MTKKIRNLMTIPKYIPEFKCSVANINWTKTKDQSNILIPLKEALLKFDENALYVMDYMIPFLFRSYENIYVDYIVENTKTAEDWHMDLVTDPWHKTKPDHHLIYTTKVPIEFLDVGFILAESVNNFKKIPIKQPPKIMSTQPEQIWEYYRHNIHRVAATRKQVTIRMSETDITF